MEKHDNPGPDSEARDEGASSTDPESTAPIPEAPGETSPPPEADQPKTPSVASEEGIGRTERAEASAFEPEPRRRRRFVPRFRTVLIALLLLLPVAAAAGVAYGTYDYSEDYKGKILPGATIAGVDVGGMEKREAVRAVRKALKPQMQREVKVRWEGHTWKVTPKKLGAKSDAKSAVETALDESGRVSMLDKAQMKFLGKDLDFQQDVAFKYPKKGPFAFVEGLASEFNRKPVDATMDYSSGWVEIHEERLGRKVDTEKSGKALLGALRSGERVAKLTVDQPKPEVTEKSFDQVLLLHQSEFTLYFYQRVDGKLKITHEWPVAVGTGGYPTPTGEYVVTELRYMPTWINPAPDGWGASMPAMIPPGPSNPLGLRAINWDASGIRFHGTSDTGSIGTAASHGCVRMYNEDVIELYDMVEVGTPIISMY
jgi:L,D-transpeptidase catalytic domain/Putative peptidoglycan binding domain